MTRSTFRVLFYANGSKEKNGIVPIMGRVTINGQPIGEWFKEQFDRLFSSIRRTVEPLRKGKGMGL